MIRSTAGFRDIFVGREAELASFTTSLDEINAGTGRTWTWSRRKPNRVRPRVFLLHGAGGMGKSTLLFRFRRQVRERESVQWVMRDWNDAAAAEIIPADLSEMLLQLLSAIAEQAGADAREHFEEYGNTQQRHERVKAEVKEQTSRARTAFDQIMSTIAGPAGNLAATALQIPPGPAQDIAGQSIALVIKGIGGGAADFATYLARHLRENLSVEDYQLHVSPDEAYAAAFNDGLVSLAEAAPLVIAQDTCELINPRLAGSFRALVMKPCIQKSAQLIFVVAGRSDHTAEYARLFQEEPHMVCAAEMTSFTKSETEDLLRAAALDVTSADDIQRQTLGVPFAVVVAAGLKRAGDGRQPAGASGRAPDSGQAIHDATERFLSYWFETENDDAETTRRKIRDRHRIYTLAVLRSYDEGAVGACWGALADQSPLPPVEVLAALAELRRNNEFLFERGQPRMQSVVREYIRKHLGQRQRSEDGWLERDVVLMLNRVALEYFDARIAARESAIGAVTARIEDKDWRRLCLAAQNHRWWVDERDAYRDFGKRLLEAGNFRHSWLRDLRDIVLDAGANPREFDKVSSGIAALTADTDILDCSSVLSMWDEVERQLPQWKLPALYRSLLAASRMRMLGRLGRSVEAAREGEQGLASLPAASEPELREKLLEGLTGVAALAVFEEHDSAKAVRLARIAVAHDPESPKANNVLVMALMGQKDYAAAHEVVDALLARKPDSADFRWMRLNLLQAEGRVEESRKELRMIAELRPDFAREVARRVLEFRTDPDLKAAVSEWFQKAGVKQVEALNRLLDLDPAVAADAIAIGLEYAAIENPTPEQAVAAKRAFAERLPGMWEVHMDLGASLLAAGELDEAMTSFSKARALAPDLPQTAVAPGLLLVQQGDYEKAVPFLEDAVAKLPGEPRLRSLLVGALASTGKVEEAGLRAADAVALFPGDHSLKFQYGSLLLATDKERGWQLRREAYQASPEVLQQVRDVLRTPGMREKVLNDFAAEAPELEALLASLPTDRLAEWYVLFSRATLEGAALNQPNYRRLIEAFEFLLADFPGSVDLRIFLAEFQDAAGDPSRALTVLQQGLPAPEPGGEDRLHLELARRFWDANDAERTVDHLSAVRRQLEPGAQRILATALEQTGRWREAVDAYDRALELGEDPNPERLLRFAFLNICLERDERGAALLEKSAAVAPDSADLHLYRSEVLYRLERYEEARAESEESLSLQPGEPTAAARLSRVLTALNRADEAAVKRDLALTLMPAATAYNQACALALLGMRNESLERLASALQEDPKLSDWAQVDADLRDLRDSPEFQQLFAAELRTAAG